MSCKNQRTCRIFVKRNENEEKADEMQELRLERARQPNSGTGQRVERRLSLPGTDDGGVAAVRSWWSENGWS